VHVGNVDLFEKWNSPCARKASVESRVTFRLFPRFTAQEAALAGLQLDAQFTWCLLVGGFADI
jgi:hypothetical protein